MKIPKLDPAMPIKVVEDILLLMETRPSGWFTKVQNLKKEYGIYPYHDGTTIIFRPARGKLKASVPAWADA